MLLAAALLVAVLARPAHAQPAEADVFVAQAILAYEEKRYDDALTALNEALRLDPNNADALYYIGLVRITQGRFAEAIEPLEKARSIDPRDQAILFQLGVTYFSLGQYDKAQPLLEQVFAANPELESLGYYVGFMRYRQKDYQGALRAFRAGRTTDPNIAQLTRFYAGLALGILGLPERAAAEIEEARRLQPASPLTGPAERLREAIVTARERERRFRAEVRLGEFYDDNVPVSPVPSGREPLIERLRKKKGSMGELGALRLDYVFWRMDSLEATATYSFFATYNNDLPGFNIMDHLGGLGGTYRDTVKELPYQLSLSYTYDFLTLGGDEFVQRHTVTPFGALVEDANNLTALQLRYQRKDFANDSNVAREEKRSGNNWLAGLSHIFRFEGDKHLLKLGYQADFDNTEGRNFRYFGHRMLAGAQYTLPWGALRLKYDFDVHFRDYRHRNTVLPSGAPNSKERYDTEYTHVLGFTYPLPYNFTLAVDYQRIDAHSNLDIFAFRRNVFSAILIWTY